MQDDFDVQRRAQIQSTPTTFSYLLGSSAPSPEDEVERNYARLYQRAQNEDLTDISVSNIVYKSGCYL